MESVDPRQSVTSHKTAATISFDAGHDDRVIMTAQHHRMQKDTRFIRQSAPPNHSLPAQAAGQGSGPGQLGAKMGA
jgi:hypothetical protein